MRTFWKNCKGILIIVSAFACAILLYCLTNAPVFSGGTGYELYYGNSSSAQVVRPDGVAVYKWIHGGAQGESVRYDGNRVQELLQEFLATVLWEEEACGIINYYCYSPKLKNGVELCGEFVNLHIAVSASQTAVGTPVIFGGF